MKLRSLALRRAAVAGALSLTMLFPATGWAQSTDDRRRAVGDWLVEDVANADGGRTVRMSHEQNGFHVDFHILVAGAAGTDSVGVASGHAGCARGGEQTVEHGRPSDYARQLEADLLHDLMGCSATPEQVDTLLAGFDGAFELASQWADERSTALAAASARPPAVAAVAAAPANPQAGADVAAAAPHTGAPDAGDSSDAPSVVVGGAEADTQDAPPAGGVWEPGSPAEDEAPAGGTGWRDDVKPR